MTTKLMMATIDLLIEVEDDEVTNGRAADLIGETLRPLLREYSEVPSDIIDWRYSTDERECFMHAKDYDGSNFEFAPQDKRISR